MLGTHCQEEGDRNLARKKNGSCHMSPLDECPAMGGRETPAFVPPEGVQMGDTHPARPETANGDTVRARETTRRLDRTREDSDGERDETP